MAFEITPGVFPVMITPWKEDNTPDFKAIEALTDWYIEKGCDGIFAICQSSEMMYLSEREKLDIARCVAETAAGRIQIVASGPSSCMIMLPPASLFSSRIPAVTLSLSMRE